MRREQGVLGFRDCFADWVVPDSQMSRRNLPASERHGVLLDLIYGAVADPDRWPEVLTRVSDYIGAVGGMLVYNAPPGSQNQNLIILGRLADEYTPTFHQHHVWNPWTLAMRDVPFGKAVVCGSLVERPIVHKTAFYADILQPQEIADMMTVSHRAMAQDGGVGGFGFGVPPHETDRADENVQRLQRLTPHLGRALDATLKLGRLADGTRQLARVLQLMPNPALLLDAKGRITLANPPAESLLRANDGLALDRDGGLRLAAALSSETAALSRALTKALAVASGAGSELGEPLRLTRPSGAAPLLVLPVPLPPPAFALWDLLEPARVLILIIDPSAHSPATAAAIQTTFGLTPAEARVAVLIGSGRSGPETAAMLGISPSTVKTHLKRCFEKTGVHSQVGLARILAALPIDPSIGGKLN
jgi:DNA-binding CsgD family transcriptional regulator/PAS domain-containing protein